MKTGVPSGEGKRAWVWLAAACVLALPAVAMRFTDEVQWTAGDFVAAAVLLAVPCAIWHWATGASRDRAWRLGMAMVALALLGTCWVNLAVGIIGEPGHPANLGFFAILLLGPLLGAAGRFRPGALRRALLAMAAAQVLLAAYAWFGAHSFEGALASVFLSAWWALASVAFARAARPVRPAH